MKFIWGSEGFLVDQEVNKEIRKLAIEPIIYTDSDSVEDLILDLATNSMFEDEKLIIVKNHHIFTKDDQVEDLIEILKKTQNNIIFSYESESLNKKVQFIKYLLKNAEVQEFPKLRANEMLGVIRKIVNSKGGIIDNNAAIMLSMKIPDDLRIVVTEIDKLLEENKHINADMVETSVGDYVKEDFFALSNAITSGDKYEIMKSYKDKKDAEVDPTSLIGQISSILLLSCSIDAHRKLGLSNREIATKMNVHPFRVKKAAEIIDLNGSDAIHKRIKDLAELDANIKMGKVSPTEGMEHYLLKLIR